MKTPAKITNQDRTRVAYLIRQEFERRLDCLRKARQPTDPDLALAQLRKTLRVEADFKRLAEAAKRVSILSKNLRDKIASHPKTEKFCRGMSGWHDPERLLERLSELLGKPTDDETTLIEKQRLKALARVEIAKTRIDLDRVLNAYINGDT